jgi:hypothetical protein
MMPYLPGVSEQLSLAEVLTALKLAATTWCLHGLAAAEHVAGIAKTNSQRKAGQLPVRRSTMVD